MRCVRSPCDVLSVAWHKDTMWPERWCERHNIAQEQKTYDAAGEAARDGVDVVREEIVVHLLGFQEAGLDRHIVRLETDMCVDLR